ncbi:MAG: hypothetical protein IJR63_11875 [Synergistaceae bacterium]|nr:hypothetical protein [Synergistaceae bacterium]
MIDDLECVTLGAYPSYPPNVLDARCSSSTCRTGANLFAEESHEGIKFSGVAKTSCTE